MEILGRITFCPAIPYQCVATSILSYCQNLSFLDS